MMLAKKAAHEVWFNIVKEALRGNVPPHWRVGKLVLLEKPEKPGKYRPVALLEILRRLASKVALRDPRLSELLKDLERSGQNGVGVPGGAERLAALARGLRERGIDIECLDLTNAFNAVERAAVIRAVARHAPFLLPYVKAMLGNASTLVVVGTGGATIDSMRGTAQGDPLSPLLFSLVLWDVITRARGKTTDMGLDVVVEAYLDDVLTVGTPEARAAFRGHFAAELSAVGLSLGAHHVNPRKFLGVPMPGADGDAYAQEKLKIVLEDIARLKFVNDTRLRYALLRDCMGSAPRLSYLACAIGGKAEAVFKTADEATLRELAEMLKTELPEAAALQASCAIRDGGMGLSPLAALAEALKADSAARHAEWTEAALRRVELALRQTLDRPETPPEDSTSQARRIQLGRQQQWLDEVEASGDKSAAAHAHDLASGGPVANAWLTAPLISRHHQQHFREAVCARLGVTVVPQARGEGAQGPRGLAPDPTGRMELGNMGGKARRHREVRDVIVTHVKTAGQRYEPEQTLEKVANMVGGVDFTKLAEAKAALAADYNTARNGAEEPRPSDLGVSSWATTARGVPQFGTSVTAVVDFTVVVPWSAEALGKQGAEMPVAARLAAERKLRGAERAMRILGAEFVPGALTVNGSMGPELVTFLKELVRRESAATGRPEEKVKEGLVRDLSIAIQRENGRILWDAGRRYQSQTAQVAERARQEAALAAARKRRRPGVTQELGAVREWLGGGGLGQAPGRASGLGEEHAGR